jgi:hypothetical protein
MSPIVYAELVNLYQYCYDYIDSSVYMDEMTKEDIYEKHEYYWEQYQEYEK